MANCLMLKYIFLISIIVNFLLKTFDKNLKKNMVITQFLTPFGGFKKTDKTIC